MRIEKATKEKAFLRAALFGPSGSGKTFTALRMAKGLGGKVCVIDTERRTASKYSDRFEFDVVNMTDTSIQSYRAALKMIADAGYQVVIIDSLSHAWQTLLDEVDKLAAGKFKGNSFQAWSVGTPKQREMVNALLDFPGHLIGTMRSKTEWTTVQNDRGKTVPTRVGLTPEQGKGIEYEFDLLLELNTEHVASVLKDRSGKFQDETIDRPGEDFGAALGAWLSDGAEPAPRVAGSVKADEPDAVLGDKAAAKMMLAFAEVGVALEDLRAIIGAKRPDHPALGKRPAEWPESWREPLTALLKKKQAEKKADAAVDAAADDQRAPPITTPDDGDPY